MTPKVSEEDFITYPKVDVKVAAQSMIAVSSMMDAVANEYAHTGVLSVGAVIHCIRVIDTVIEKLGLAEIDLEQDSLPF